MPSRHPERWHRVSLIKEKGGGTYHESGGGNRSLKPVGRPKEKPAGRGDGGLITKKEKRHRLREGRFRQRMTSVKCRKVQTTAKDQAKGK